MNRFNHIRVSMGSGRIWACLVIAFLSVILFHPVLKTYAYTDVYEFLYHAHNDNFIHVFIQGGRPVYGLINKFFLTSVGSVDQLSWLRLFGVTGVVLATCIFFILLNRFILGLFLSMLCALGFLFSPAAGITGLWVGTYQVGWVLALALAGGYYLMMAVMQSGGTKWIQITGSMALGLLSLLTYQPAFTAFLIPGLLHFLKHVDLKSTRRFLALYFSMYGIYYGIHLLILQLTHLQPISRTSLTNDPFGKLVWFFRRPVRMVLEDNFIFYPVGWRYAMAILFTILSLTAIYYLVRKKNLKNTTIIPAVVGIFLFSTHIPNLISSDNWVSYRTLSTLFMFKWVLVSFAIGELQKRFRFAGAAIASSFCLILPVNSWYNINKGFVSIQSKEYMLIKNEVSRLVPAMRLKKELLFVKPEFEFLETEGIVRRVVSDEFGSLSTSRDWVPVPMVRQILKELGEPRLEKELKVMTVKSSDFIPELRGREIPVINPGALFKDKP